MRDAADSPRREVPSDQWAFADDHAIRLLPAGTKLKPLAIYDIWYEARDPKLTGIGLAATRDLVSFLRYASKDSQGNASLHRVQWRDGNGLVTTHEIRHVFVMMGAVPNTHWLEGCVALNEKGFIKTGADLTPDDLAAAAWRLTRPPYLLETSLPGVFAVGDVRSGSVKRVASAVGEGSMAVRLVHEHLEQAHRA